MRAGIKGLGSEVRLNGLQVFGGAGLRGKGLGHVGSRFQDLGMEGSPRGS